MTLVAALTPILVLSAISAYLDATRGMDDRRANLLLVADASLDGVEQSINEATLMLTLQRDDLAHRRCKKVFNILQDRIVPLANVARFDTEGVATCSAASDPGWSLPDPENNARLKRGEKTVRSETYFSDRSGEWLFAILMRLEDEEGAFAGSAGLELRTEQLASLMHADALPDGVEVALLDDRGESFGSKRFAKVDPDWVSSVANAESAELFVLTGEDGESLDVVIQPVGPGNVFAAISRKSPGLWSDFTLRPVRSIGLPLVTFSVALLAVWIAIDSLVLRWLSRLTRTVRVYGAGRYQFKAGDTFDKAPDEISKLAHAMDVMAKDIDERDKDLKLAIASRAEAVREIHHRVKNNLQIVTSFLNLQGRQLRDPEAKAAISAARHRIDALAIVHQTLYQNERLEQVRLEPFLSVLVTHLSEALGMDESNVEIVQTYADVERLADDAIPMALFIVEAVTNAMKYAFGPAGGQIRISLGVDVDGTTLVISDNGRGFDPSTTSETENGGGLGSKLMTAFSRQLSAELTVDASIDCGCRVTLFMPRNA
ncbi:sensor histidine kinase [Hyphomonas sp.]|jgi:two-component sensor histidine kinase|uniref:sensor histidine kinase n=1 Tax=Hyphomonas sp. TaxID=87 RepID=UPI0039E51204